jgi:hypothetical protein
MLISNPVMVGTDTNSIVFILNSTFFNVNLNRTTLVFDYFSSTFNFTNTLFKFVHLCWCCVWKCYIPSYYH